MIPRTHLIVDNFAGGGGASLGIERALGRSPDIAINHDPEAIAMHAANHPETRHYCESVWDVNPSEVCAGRPVAFAWFSPDCKHFSKAKGGKPVDKRIRGLAWIVIRWAKAVRPAVIVLENVEEFQTWGPLRDDGRPCPMRRGRTFRRWRGALERLGYQVELRELRACDFGAPTIRKRLFVIARCDGKAISWPRAAYGRGLKPFRTAAECIDWSLPCPSIFERPRPLAENTMRRIARGVWRYVIGAREPFIVPMQHDNRPVSIDEPLQTITTQGNKFNLVSPTLVEIGYGERPGQSPRAPGLERPLGTVVAGGQKHALVAALLARHYGGHENDGAPLATPIPTITSTDHHSLVTAHMLKLHGSCADGQSIDAPAPTIRAEGTHLAEVRAFLVKYYGQGLGQRLDEPAHTVTTKDRLGLVTVHGATYAIADIGMRMLSPRELYRAQGFPDSYVIAPLLKGKPLSKSAQVRMCGNSVCPPLAEQIARSQYSNVAPAAAEDVAFDLFGQVAS